MADGKEHQKRKRVILTIENKIDICNRLENGESRKNIMQEYGIASSTVYDIHKQKDDLRKFYSASESTKAIKQRKTLRKPKLEQLDAILYEWFVSKRSEGSPITGPIIKEKAKEFYEKLKLTEKCTFSEGWLAGFKSRHAIQKLDIFGETKSSDTNAAKDYVHSFAKLVQEHSLSSDQIYNAAETELLWRCLPDKTLTDEKDAAEFKSNQDKLTVLCCANASGTHRIKLLVIGKDEYPCSQQLPVQYVAESNEDIFKNWFLHTFVPSVKEQFVSVGLPESSKCLLLLDNCSAYPYELELSSGNIFVKYLPPNVAVLIQPMNQGITQNMKSFYQRDFLRKMVKSEETLPTFQNSFDIKDALFNVACAWNLIKKDTLRRAWKTLWPVAISADGTSGLEANIVDEYDNREEIREMASSFRNDESSTEVQEWLKTEEDSTEITCTMSEDALINPFLNADHQTIPNEFFYEAEEASNENVSWATAAEAYNILIKFAESKPCHSADEIMQLHALHYVFLQKRQEPLKQTDIRRSFKKVCHQK